MNTAREWNSKDGEPLIRVRLANGQPAYTRNLRVTQSMIRQHGSYAQAREALIRERRFS